MVAVQQFLAHLSLLGALKFLGLAIGSASTIWGMTRTTSFDDQGRKRLTRAGHVAVALALGSFLVAVISYGFETLANAAAQEARAADEFRNEERAKRTLDLVALNRAEGLSRAAEERAGRAEDRLRRLNAEREQQERDLALSREVNRGSRRNLIRTGAALGQLERVLYPVRELSVRVDWIVPRRMPGLLVLRDRLYKLAQQYNGTDRAKACEDGHEPDCDIASGIVIAVKNGSVTGVYISKYSKLYENQESDSDKSLSILLGDPWLDFYFSAPGVQPRVLRPGFADFFVQTGGYSLYFDLVHDNVHLQSFSTFPLNVSTGTVVSISDLENTTIAIRLVPAVASNDKVNEVYDEITMGEIEVIALFQHYYIELGKRAQMHSLLENGMKNRSWIVNRLGPRAYRM